MNNYGDLILRYQSGEMSIAERAEFKRELSLSVELRKEFLFQEKLDKVMKRSLSLEGIESDPNLIKAEIMAQKDIDSYLNRKRNSSTTLSSNSIEVEAEVEIRKRIAKAEVEMVLAGIDDITEEWVRSFDERKPEIQGDKKARRVFEYIKKGESSQENIIQMPAATHRVTRKVIFQAAAAVFILSLLLFKALTPNYSGSSVYKHYYEPLEANSYQLRGNVQDASSKLQEGVDFYLSKNYDKAEIAFNDLRKMKYIQPEVLLYTGLNEMGQNNFQQAITTFNDLLAHQDQFVPEAQWYLALCYIKTGDKQKAQSLMSMLSETEGIYKKKAQTILKNLNR